MRWADVMQDEPVEAAPSIPPPHGVGLWIVGLYFALGAAYGLLFNLSIRAGFFTFDPEAQAILDRTPTWELIISLVVMALNLAGGVLLLARFRLAMWMLFFSAGINLAHIFYGAARGNFLIPGASAALAAFTFTLLAVGLTLEAAALVYVVVLHRRGILYRTVPLKRLYSTSGPG